MDLNGIIAELESFNLEREETRNAAENLQAAVVYFFERIQSKANWSITELEALKETCKVDRCLEMVNDALNDHESDDV